jgi:hypothetical protein
MYCDGSLKLGGGGAGVLFISSRGEQLKYVIGPLTTAPGGFTHVLVAIDKFTKWIEYKPITMLPADRVVTFICDILNHFQWLTRGPMTRLSAPTV